jgi:hypothetical protein
MDFPEYPKPIREALVNIVEAAASDPDFSCIKDQHVRPYIDNDVLKAWCEMQGGIVGTLRAIADQLEITLKRRDQQGRDEDMIDALSRNAPMPALHCALSRAVMDEFADLAYPKAQQSFEWKREPDDIWDDPVRADRHREAVDHNSRMYELVVGGAA